MAKATTTRPRDADPATLEALAIELTGELPEDFRYAVSSTKNEATALAWLVLDLGQRYERLRTALDNYLWRETEKIDNGGDLQNAVAQECGLGVVWEVLQGLAEALSGGTCTDEVAQHHAADHYREIGRPAIVLDAERAEVDLVGNVVKVTPHGHIAIHSDRHISGEVNAKQVDAWLASLELAAGKLRETLLL